MHGPEFSARETVIDDRARGEVLSRVCNLSRDCCRACGDHAEMVKLDPRAVDDQTRGGVVCVDAAHMLLGKFD